MGVSDMRQPHEVLVQRRSQTTTAHGRTLINTGNPVPLKCNFRLLGSGEIAANGIVTTYDARLLTTSAWPGGAMDNDSLITFDGISYEMDGIPLKRDGSRRTAHLQVNLRFVGRPRG